MKKPLQVGLVVEGNATSSPVLRLSCIVEELGPIKSVGLQVARRISNFLRAGYGVTDYLDLGRANLILLRLPDSEVRRVVDELCETELPFGELSFVVCETWLTADVLAPLRRRGSQAASLVSTVPHSQNSFAVEGDLGAVRKIKRLLERGGARAIELRPGTKPGYFAANLLVTAIPIPVLQLAQQALRDSGVAGNDLAVLMNEWSEVLRHRVKKGGRAAWGGPLAECSAEVANEHLRLLALRDPGLALALNEWLALAKRKTAKRAKSQAAGVS
jgi:predicted short-subunit dehydrogenase-like oxidoreductase (DUF2520 family)